MLLNLLLPNASQLSCDRLFRLGRTLCIDLLTTTNGARCPACQTLSRQQHSTYLRIVADLPWADWQVSLRIQVKRYFCRHPGCAKVTFAERLPGIVKPYRRRTIRLIEKQTRAAHEMSGEVAAKVCELFNLPISGDTAIRLIRDTPENEIDNPTVLGVDDWAMCKDQTYGTILVDLERRQVVDLLTDRTEETFATWLKAHPGIKIITRDRAPEYAAAAAQAAPNAVQVADRFHLLRNIYDVQRRFLDRHPEVLRKAAQQATRMYTVETDPAGSPSDQTVSHRQLLFEEVKTLQRQGWNYCQIARHLHIDRRTVRRCFHFKEYPGRSTGAGPRSTILPYLDYVIRRWQEDGCHNQKKIYRELQGMGYGGSYSSVWGAIKQAIRDGKIEGVRRSSVPKVRRLSVAKAAWLMVIDPETLSSEDELLRQTLCQLSSVLELAYQLAQRFVRMVRERPVEELELWITDAVNSGIPSFNRFVETLKLDYAAVRAALTLPWSNGQVEGRAKFDLLRRHILPVV